MKHIKKFNEDYRSNELDLSKDQNLMTISPEGQEKSYIEIKDGKIVTSGWVGYNTYDNFVELIKGLQGFDIKIDDFFW